MAMIMVVDDNNGVRTVTGMTLKADGHQVIESKGGEDCLNKLKKGSRPDLILLDVMMPFMDGWAVSHEIKLDKNLKNIPICMLTAKTTPLDELMSLESAHADWHLNKPVSIKKLIETIDWLLTPKQNNEN
jgi:CheY-like chemotaxis protein